MNNNNNKANYHWMMTMCDNELLNCSYAFINRQNVAKAMVFEYQHANLRQILVKPSELKRNKRANLLTIIWGWFAWLFLCEKWHSFIGFVCIACEIRKILNFASILAPIIVMSIPYYISKNWFIKKWDGNYYYAKKKKCRSILSK